MSRCGWDAVWYPGGGGDASSPRYEPAPGDRWWHFLRKGACLVGTWTGPDVDLLCVREATTAAEAELWLSPPGRFVLDAALRSLWLRWFGPCQSPSPPLTRPMPPSSFDDEPSAADPNNFVAGTHCGMDLALYSRDMKDDPE